jgi:hypothetical protein
VQGVPAPKVCAPAASIRIHRHEPEDDSMAADQLDAVAATLTTSEPVEASVV